MKKKYRKRTLALIYGVVLTVIASLSNIPIEYLTFAVVCMLWYYVSQGE